MVKEPLSPPEARKLIRQLLEGGTVIFTRHARQETLKDELGTDDCVNVLRAGSSGPRPDRHHGMEKELMQCPTCRETSFSVHREDRPYVEAGLPQVLLMGIEVSVCQNCGEELLAIPKISQLHRVIAWALTRQRPKLRGNEIRFLRKSLGLSGVDFAAAIGVTPETVSRWENEKEPMSKTAERLLRLLVATREPVESYPIETLAEAGEDPVSPRTIDVTVTQQGWRVAEAA